MKLTGKQSSQTFNITCHILYISASLGNYGMNQFRNVCAKKWIRGITNGRAGQPIMHPLLNECFVKKEAISWPSYVSWYVHRINDWIIHHSWGNTMQMLCNGYGNANNVDVFIWQTLFNTTLIFSSTGMMKYHSYINPLNMFMFTKMPD